ncbi:MAG TPA: hypothetical protein VGC39_11440 [Candidatus Methylacidiphilales bacterium]
MNRSLKLNLALLLATCWWGRAPAQVYVSYSNAGLISEYDVDTGAMINETFIVGLDHPHGLCVEHGFLYVIQSDAKCVSKYDAKTGEVVNPELVRELNLPQALAVSDNALYVAQFDWITGRPRIGKYNAATGAPMNTDLIPHLTTEPSSLAVSGNSLFVAAEGPLMQYDATTGALLNPRFGRVIYSPTGLAQMDHWLWITGGANAPTGAVLKVDAETGLSAVSGGLFRPLITGLNYPGVIAVSGDDLFIGGGKGTAVARYNATTGDVINANFIPSMHDRFGGLAVVARERSDKYGVQDLEFGLKHAFLNFAWILAINGNYVFLAAGIVATLVVVGVFSLLFRRRTPVPLAASPVAPASAQPAPARASAATAEPEFAPPPRPEGTPTHEDPVRAVEPPPRSLSTLTVVIIVLFIVTLLTAAILGYCVYDWAISFYLEQTHPGVNAPVP